MKNLIVLGLCLVGSLLSAKPLGLKVYTADENGFLVTSTLILGEKEAILVDAQFSNSNALRVAADVLESGKKLTTIFITHAHPDHYFGLDTLKTTFPAVKIVAAKATVADFRATAKKKLAVWGPKLGANGPKKLLTPSPLKGDLELDGEKIEVLSPVAGDSAANSVLWIPAQKTLIAGDVVYGGAHAWTADSTVESRKNWIAALDKLAALAPETVIAGHYQVGSPRDASAIEHTKQYLIAFDEELPKARNSAELIAAMIARYAKAGLVVAVDLGAKVAKGEIKWD